MEGEEDEDEEEYEDEEEDPIAGTSIKVIHMCRILDRVTLGSSLMSVACHVSGILVHTSGVAFN